MFKQIVLQTDNLRSSVVKNACMTLNTLFEQLSKKDLDPYVEIVVEALIKKAADANKFVAKEGELALEQVCKNCTDTKVYKYLNV
jgi:hypothetical protein